MARSDLLTVIRHAGGCDTPDADLLRRFADAADQRAFAELVRRHARLVWGQCRNLLSNEADADDAFQATFLTLARSARTVRDTARLGPWLHGVAYRVCLNARRAAARRTKRERGSAVREAVRPVADSAWDAAAAAVHEEVSRLPESLRVPFVLCVLEGTAPTAAAAQLGLKWGTFAARLSRAKQRLLDRLSARGIGSAVAVGAVGLVAIVPASAVERAVVVGAAGARVPASVLTLCSGVHGMSRVKLLAVLAMTAVGVSAMLLPVGDPPSVPVARAAPVPPKQDPPTKEMLLKQAWADLASSDDLTASRALLTLRENATAAFFADRLKPLKLTEERAKELLADLGSDDEKVWRAAYEELSYLDPRLAIGLKDVLTAGNGQAFEERLAALLCGKVPADAEACRWCKSSWTFYKMPAKDGGLAATMMLTNHPDKPAEFQTMLDRSNNPRGAGFGVAADAKALSAFTTNPLWRRAVRAVALLEAFGTDEAKKVLQGMADGHADAGPTIAAKASLERPKK